jgi:hypothetical protein
LQEHVGSGELVDDVEIAGCTPKLGEPTTYDGSVVLFPGHDDFLSGFRLRKETYDLFSLPQPNRVIQRKHPASCALIRKVSKIRGCLANEAPNGFEGKKWSAPKSTSSYLVGNEDWKGVIQ